MHGAKSPRRKPPRPHVRCRLGLFPFQRHLLTLISFLKNRSCGKCCFHISAVLLCYRAVANVLVDVGRVCVRLRASFPSLPPASAWFEFDLSTKLMCIWSFCLSLFLLEPVVLLLPFPLYLPLPFLPGHL